jgi:hypothetical protein
MAVFLFIIILCASDLKKKRTLTVYKNITRYNNKQKHSHDSVTIYSSNMLSIWVMAVFFLDHNTVLRSDRQWVFFST